MIAMSLAHYTSLLKRYVSLTGVPILAVEYRLAPEVRAPVPVTDCHAGLRYLFQHAADLGVDTARIAIMGDSAGGGITASLAHYINLHPSPGPIVAIQVLIYPMLDDRTTQPDEALAPFATWSANDNITGWGALLGDRAGSADVNVTEAAGRMTLEDARGLPPAYIDVGELDLFRDDALAYAQTLGRAGVSCELHVVPSVPHAYEIFAPEADVSGYTMEQRVRVIKSI